MAKRIATKTNKQISYDQKAKDQLVEYHDVIKNLNEQVRLNQASMITIVRLMGWSIKEANDILGINFFVENDDNKQLTTD